MVNRTDGDGYCKWCGFPKSNQHKDHEYEPNDCSDSWHSQVHGLGAECPACGMTSVFTPNGMRRVIPCARLSEFAPEEPKDGYVDLTEKVEPWSNL